MKQRSESRVLDSRGAQKWRELSQEWERSGLPQTEFCRQRGLAVHTLRWWRWRLRLGGARKLARRLKAAVGVPSSSSPMPSFVPVQVIAEARQPRRRELPTMDIVLRRRRRVRIDADFDARMLARVVRVLEAIP